MSRINSNIASLQAQHTLAKNNQNLSTRLQRLSTGLKINTGKDAPAKLIASETLRSEIAGITQAVENTTRANSVINVAEGALSEVSALLLSMQSLTNEAANTGALSPDEIAANQLQVDSILSSINRIANTTQFGGIKLLNGSLDYQTENVSGSAVEVVNAFAAKLPDNGTVQVGVAVVGSAQLAQTVYSGATVGSVPVTIEVAGNDGAEQLTFAASTAIADVATAVNGLTAATGVTARVSGTDLAFESVEYGSKKYVSVQAIGATPFAVTSAKDFGQDAEVNVNGAKAEVDGLRVQARNSGLDLELVLSSDFAQAVGGTTAFDIVGGGAKFQVGSEVNRQGQVNVGVTSLSTSRLGDNVVGYLSSLGSGGDNSLVGGNTVQAQKVLNEAISQVSSLRGRLGALQKDVFETNINSLNVALENVTASESAIRDADFAAETAALTRAQILVQANTSILSQANSTPQNVLSLLQ